MPKNNDWLLDSTEFNPTAKSEPSTPLAHANSSVISTSFCHPDDYDFIVSQIEANIAGTISTHQQSIISTSKSLTQPQQHQPKTDRLTAETLRIFSSINIENLSFTSKFDLLFNDLSMLKATAVQGLLGDTNFRFLSWMIFLECVPMEKNSWLDVIGQNRLDYERIKKELACDPQLVKNSSEWAVNFDHPLSQDETSVWNNYFEQNRVKSVIIQDVNRINQHSAYFALESTRDSIVNLIFMYVQSMKVEYKQGMHEILTCIMFVLHEEYSSLTKLSETK